MFIDTGTLTKKMKAVASQNESKERGKADEVKEKYK